MGLKLVYPYTFQFLNLNDEKVYIHHSFYLQLCFWLKIFIIFVKLNVNIQIMKKIISFLFTILLFQFSYAQLQSPVASPRAKVSQKVGLVDINLDYSRPSKKGRAIFGNIVPFDQIWRTGANQATSISFSELICSVKRSCFLW